MKKTYIAPSCKIRLVKKCNIIATSFGNTNDTTGYKGNSGGYSRGWDDDDWEED